MNERNARVPFDGTKQPTQRRPHAISHPEPFEAVPRILSPVPPETDIAEAEEGSRWLGLGLFEQGRQIARVMNAVKMAPSLNKNRVLDPVPLYDTVGVEIPRRSTKTTAILAVLVGRCLARSGYRVANTAQDGLRARNKLKEVMTALRRAGFEEQGLGKLHFSNGTEHIDFTNGSYWAALPPDPGAFRSDAFDAILIDEAGELAPEKADALQAGVLPTQDTRPQSQTIVAGTPGLSRAGLLWTTLADLEAGTPGVGGVVYAASDTETFADLTDPDNPVYDTSLLRRVHPGIACGLTTVEKILSRIPKMGLAKWTAEYLCQWPRDAATAALDVAGWRACASTEPMPERPERVGIGWDVDPDGSQGAVVAAWRDARGRAVFEVLGCEGGTDWLPRVVRDAEAKHKTASVYDPIGQNLEVAERLGRSPFRSRTRPLKMQALVGAAARIEKEIAKRNVVHFDQSDLTEAVQGVTWRPAGKDGRLFARKASAASAACVVAASEALWDYDTGTRPARRRRIVSSATQSTARADR